MSSGRRRQCHKDHGRALKRRDSPSSSSPSSSIGSPHFDRHSKGRRHHRHRYLPVSDDSSQGIGRLTYLPRPPRRLPAPSVRSTPLSPLPSPASSESPSKKPRSPALWAMLDEHKTWNLSGKDFGLDPLQNNFLWFLRPIRER